MKYALEGVVVKKLTFELIKRGDLIFFEGPVLSYFVDENGHDYLMRWTEMDDTANRWLLFQVNKEQIGRHLAGKVSLLSLLKKTESGAVYFLDIDNDIEYHHIKYVEVGRIPEQYLPEKDSYFDMKYGTTYAKELEAELKGQLKRQKQVQSFLETATVSLFGKHSIENKLASRNGPFCYMHDPSYFPEQYVLSLIDFPLLLHRHANKTSYFEYSFVGNGTTFSDILGRLQGYGTGFANSFSLDKLTTDEIYTLVERILDSAQNIVNEHPDEYLSLYEEWKKVLIKNLAEINTIDRVLHDKFVHDVEDNLVSA